MQCSGYGKAERCDDGIEAVTVLGHHLIAACMLPTQVGSNVPLV